ncbi:MAG: gluconate 2-dehydrogenase subunit 3 family protein [Pyrinomonadaceae bacterium]
MKRRQFLKGMAASALVLPAARPAFTQQPEFRTPTPTPAPTPTPVCPPPRPFSDLPKVVFDVPDLAAQATHRFFTEDQFATLQKLSDILVPTTPGNPGALEARAPEFLDFLIRASPPDRQQIYRVGLDKLNKEAAKRFKKPFAGVDAAQAGTLLAPLRHPWTFEPPADPLARFLREAKKDVRGATFSSYEWNTAAGRDPDDAVGRFWYPLD